MSKKDFYIEQSCNLKDEIIETMNRKTSGLDLEQMSNPYPEMENIILKFLHLVYAFDKHLPLNEHISQINRFKFNPLSFGEERTKKEFEKLLYYVDFFIDYLKEYAD
ncbi:hypothetical protein [uncultured Bacteroides sp.]|uniref:hypothetical protein n=1 Tax=uncultured Bacteroides sp. TaxID=162156 RepID=UPI0026244A73|nr:hypothetical protein [uncultured Bacteroides sp.]